MTDRDLERRAQRRLAVLRHVEEVSFNVAATCRYYGISRQCYYGWLRRYQADGLEGLKDRSSRPHNSPRVTQAEVIEKIVWLRKHYHFGPAKIAMYLARYHDVTISTSGVWRILKRLEMNRLPASQRYQRRALRWKLREATPRPPAPGRRQNHRTTRPNRPSAQVLPVHRDRRLHPPAGAARLPALRPEDRHRLHRPRSVQAAVRRPAGANRQRIRIRRLVPLASTRQRHRPRQNQTSDAPAERQGGEIPPDRLRGVLPAPQGPSHRRRQRLLREAARVGELLQLPPPSRRFKRPNTIRTPPAENPRPAVIGLRQLHTGGSRLRHNGSVGGVKWSVLLCDS